MEREVLNAWAARGGSASASESRTGLFAGVQAALSHGLHGSEGTGGHVSGGVQLLFLLSTPSRRFREHSPCSVHSPCSAPLTPSALPPQAAFPLRILLAPLSPLLSPPRRLKCVVRGQHIRQRAPPRALWGHRDPVRGAVCGPAGRAGQAQWAGARGGGAGWGAGGRACPATLTAAQCVICSCVSGIRRVAEGFWGCRG